MVAPRAGGRVRLVGQQVALQNLVGVRAQDVARQADPAVFPDVVVVVFEDVEQPEMVLREMSPDATRRVRLAK